MMRVSLGIALLVSLSLLAACATAPSPANWSATASANPGFTGAGANVTAVSSGRGTSVAVAFREASGMSGTVRPWHVHYGTCGNDQGIVGDANLYAPLRPASDGTATTTSMIPMALSPDRSYFINIHKSPSELSTIVACGQLNPGSSMVSVPTSRPMTSSYDSPASSSHGTAHGNHGKP
jgi:hypothetical protein